MRQKIKLIWHEPSNSLAVADSYAGGCPLITILDDDVKMINPFFSYPLEWLFKYYGWVDLGDLCPK